MGRSRAIEITLAGDDLDAPTAELYGYINRAVSDAELDDFVASFVRRILSFDGKALSTAKQILNLAFMPDEDQLEATQATFGVTLRWPQAAELLAKARGLGLGTVGEFELELGRRVADLRDGA